jgi:hypothetical protein
MNAAAGEMPPAVASGIGASSWLRVLRRYMIFVALANLVWEFAHLPLYTIWVTGTPGELAFAVHCTGGDILIALSSLVLALFLVGDPAGPARAHRRAVALTVAFGLAYTVFSEVVEHRDPRGLGLSRPDAGDPGDRCRAVAPHAVDRDPPPSP